MIKYHNRDWLFNMYVTQGRSKADIARLCEVSHGAIIKWLKKHNIQSRKRPSTAGVLNPHWKGGKYISSQGYRFIIQREHPRANSNGYVSEAILIAEKILGRYLLKDEVIHHIDSNKLNNESSNLYLFTKKEHDDYHHLLRWKKIERITKSNLSMNG